MSTPMKSSPKDEVVDAPGLESIFKDLGSRTGKTRSLQSGGRISIDNTSDAQVESKTPGTMIKPKKLYAWDRAPEPTGPDEYDVRGAAGSIGESIGGLSTISDAAVITQAVKKINDMATTIRSLAHESRVRDQEVAEREELLGQVIVALKGQVSDLYGEVDNLRQDTSMAALFQGLEPALMPTQSSKLTPQD